MRMLRLAPSQRLAPYVRDFTFVEADEEVVRLLIPETGVVVGFRYSGFARQLDLGTTGCLPNATLAGMRGRARRMFTSAGGGIILATFHAGGAAEFFSEPIHEFFDSTVALDSILPRRDVDRTLCRIAEAASPVARVAQFEDFLWSRRRAKPRDPLIGAAVAAIRAAPSAYRIRELAHHLSLSHDRFEKRFRRSVGTSPKQFASLLRLRRAIDLRGAGTSFTQVSLDAGYFDQSHFIREFRSVTGASPRRFFDANEHC